MNFSMKLSLVLSISLLTSTTAFAEPEFYEHTIKGDWDGAEVVYAIDVDGDGDIDVVGAASLADDITWWENDGHENFTEHTIDDNFDRAAGVYAADIDGDGDIDILGAAQTDDDLTWWENDGSESFTERTIDANFNGAVSVFAKDVDRDGHMDVLGAAYDDNDISWYENDGTPSDGGWTEHVIEGDFGGALMVFATDMDNDGDIDVLGAALNDDDIAWFENDGSESFTERTIDDTFDGAASVFATDVDLDGDVDVLGTAAFADDITWWENDGSPSDGGWTEHTIKGDYDGASNVYATDVDGDGDIDILGTGRYDNAVTWWENDGSETFTELTIVDDLTDAITVYATDVDQDGYVDILATGYVADDITWWENLTEPPTVPTFEHHTIKGDFDHAQEVYAADLDSDGDVDVLGVAFWADDITWWENDGSESFTERTIDGDFDGVASVYATDVDGDGDIDVLGGAQFADDLTWWENDGTPSDGGWTEHTIDGNFDAGDVYAKDIDSDGDIDVLCAGVSDDDIAWYENDGSESFTKRIIDGTIDSPSSVYATDVDGDGDIDVLGTSFNDYDIAWWENDGTPSDGGWTEHTIDGDYRYPYSIYAIDMDCDGDIDVLSTSNLDDEITWWENDGSESFTERTIDSAFDAGTSVFAADVDGDGDIDVLGSAFTDDDITWFENDGTPSDGGWIEHTIHGTFDGARWVYATDIDSDGDIDVLGTAQTADDIAWWENKQIPQPAPSTWGEELVDGSFDAASSVYATDVDGDGDTDVLGTAQVADDITWWENDGSESFTEHTILGTFDGARSVYAADVDGDGDIDVLGAADVDDDITWWENDGSESFTERTIDGAFDGAVSVFAADVDGDGDVDVLGAAYEDDDITWWENDGSPSDGGWTEHTIDGSFTYAYSVYAKDIDSDGDMDVLGVASGDDDITWFENDGSESFTERTIDGDFDGAISVYATDVDGDGDIDVLGAAFNADDITWWENDGTPSDGGWTEHTIGGDIDGARSVHAADMDNDGDVDVIAAARIGDYITVFWNDGKENFTQDTIYASFNGALSVYATDFGEDGDMDVVCAADTDDDILLLTSDLNPITSPMRFKHSVPYDKMTMLGIPVKVSDGDPLVLFQDDIDSASVSRTTWRLSVWDHVNEKYVRYDEHDMPEVGGDQDPPDFSPGIGYWFGQAVIDNCELDITSAQATEVVNQSAPFSISANKPNTTSDYRGLRVLANPFNYDYDWRRTYIYDETNDLRKTLYEAAQSSWISGYAYVWDHFASQYVNYNFNGTSEPFIIKPWQGFWFEQLDEDRTLSVEFIPRGHLIADDQNENEDKWELQLQLHSADDKYRDENNWIGVDSRSQDDYDFIDAIEFTPASSEWVQLLFVRDEWEPLADRFSKDIRSKVFPDSVKHWEFNVRGWKVPETEVVVSWDASTVPDNYSLFLTDDDSLYVDMCDASEFSFVTADEDYSDRSFEIVVYQTPTDVEPGGDLIPTEFGLISLYPNPFNNVLRVSYGLPVARDIKLSVFDVQGRFVDTIHEGRMQPGRYDAAWNAAQMPSGSYFIELKSGTEVSRSTVRLTK